MLNVGLTGNVASGKSTVVTHFAAWGATVLDADRLVREEQAPGTPTHDAIIRAFGREVLLADGTLDRVWLRRRILQDDTARARLNGIVHPAVRKRRARLAAAAGARGDAVLVNDIPLLFEVLDPDQFDLVVLVDAPADVRRQRLVKHRGLATEDADRLIEMQLPSVEKRERSHIVIDNTGSLAALERSAWDAWRELRQAAARTTDGGRGPLLIAIAHGQDLIATMRGTVARYRDADVEIHVVSATTTPSVPGFSRIVALGRSPGTLDPDDATATSALAKAATDGRPTTVVTFGPDGLNGDADHRAVHAWTRQALSHLAAPPRLIYLANAPRLEADLKDPVLFGIDVRPWAEQGVPDERPTTIPCGVSMRSTQAQAKMPGREWYRVAAS
ncbi:MAG: dephospho-CoA kinase [Gemmatimonadota bacterium]|nr:dephospho-CoA kinase [Gemmatimonadota bacterium]MDH3366568.1 dephospho-CoA kinase [Gemmatimonadota bacterium]MDH3477731.1 dephospho-CoA kinase [Gemmatimonadota bacterium]MDH3570519.1 dephospho-CoA kinase [Gemmatimonadota bacterium]MDH5548862.1 dephospho-CoA kinase [Gemmatimonadota bacterium]